MSGIILGSGICIGMFSLLLLWLIDSAQTKLAKIGFIMFIVGVMLFISSFKVEEIITNKEFLNTNLHKAEITTVTNLSKESIESSHSTFHTNFKPESSSNIKLGDLVEITYYESQLNTKYIYSIKVLEIKK